MTNIEIAKMIIDAPSACADIKMCAENYISSIGTENENECARLLIAEAEEDIMKNEDVYIFMCSDKAKELFGVDAADKLKAHHKELLEKGVMYCDCPGCTAAKAVIDNKELFLK